MKISDLQHDTHNANRGTERGSEAIAESLRRYGAGRSVLVDKNGVLIAGNKTVQQAKAAGLDDAIVVQTDGSRLVVVQRVDLDLRTDAKAKALGLADNRSGQLSLEWDAEVLTDLASELDLQPFFSDKELAAFQVDEVPNSDDDDDIVPQAPRVSESLPGDLILLGSHRLLCGDSTSAADVERLMDGTDADLVFTDPPYNVDYDPEARHSTFSPKRRANKLGKIKNDSKSQKDFRDFLDAAFSRMDEHLKPGCAIYVCHADTEGHNFRSAFIAQPWKLQSCLIWKKTVLVFGRADYHWLHEPILYGWKEGAPHRWLGDRKQTTVIEIPTDHYAKADCDTDGYVHPTQKPVRLITTAIENSTQKGDVVMDLFGGSGSTLIACEKTGRSARLMELDPLFCDVIVQRWENFTGQKAERVNP